MAYEGPLRRQEDSAPPGDRGVRERRQGTRARGTGRRSDDSIQEEIRQSFTEHPDLDASEVEVIVEGGEVTLTGSVEDRDARWLAEDLVESVLGVSLVHNRLRVSND
jgi:osmotically-inducible protein OsmY